MSAVLTPVEIARLAYQAGFRGEALTTAVAVSLAESSGHPGDIGDVGLETSTWGPSVGLWQIRSLNDQSGTGGQRDAKANLNPLTNARHAYQISDHGTNWGAWTTYTKGAYRSYLGVASKAERTVTANPPGHPGTPHGGKGSGSGTTTVGGGGKGSGSGTTTVGGGGKGSGSGTTTGGGRSSKASGHHGDKRVEISLSEMKTLSSLLEEGREDVTRRQPIAQQAVTDLQQAVSLPTVGSQATSLVPMASELVSVLAQLAAGLSDDDQMVRTTHAKAVQSQSGSTLIHLLEGAGLPPSVAGLLTGGGDKKKASTKKKPVTVAGTHHSTGPSVKAQEQKVIHAAERYLGVPYVYGGDSSQGVDCSGLTSLAYANAFGKNIGRDTTEQLASGKTVGKDGDWSLDRKLLQPGDLVFYGQPGASGPNAHVVMYIGDGKVIQAPQPGQKVEIVPLFPSASADEPFLGVRRYITPSSASTLA